MCAKAVVCITIISLPVAEALSSLNLNAVKGTACPGGELVYNCTVSSSTRMDFDIRWREAMTILPSVFYLYDQPLNNGSFGDFTTTASIIPPDYTLTSTATLRGAQFSHNNYVLECFSQVQTPGLSGSAVLQGTNSSNMYQIYCFLAVFSQSREQVNHL